MRNALAFVFAVATCVPAGAACYENIGCTDGDRFSKPALQRLSCDDLWFVRNTIYDENGYCFKTADAQAEFDNSDCSVRDAAKVKLSKIEQANIASIRAVEKQKACTR